MTPLALDGQRICPTKTTKVILNSSADHAWAHVIIRQLLWQFKF